MLGEGFRPLLLLMLTTQPLPLSFMAGHSHLVKRWTACRLMLSVRSHSSGSPAQQRQSGSAPGWGCSQHQPEGQLWGLCASRGHSQDSIASGLAGQGLRLLH